MTKGTLVALAAVGLFAGETSSQESSVVLAFPGDFLASDLPTTGQGWFAVDQTPTGMTLAETRIEVTRVPAACAGATTRITAVDASEPLFLVRGLPSFRPGPLDSVFDKRRFIYPGEELTLRLESGARLGFQAYGSASPAAGEVRISDYEIRMYRGTRTQTLAKLPQIDWDGPPQLIWAGDLDRDGGLDALLDLRTSYAGHHYVLFLSSGSRDDELVRRVAEFPAAGC